MRLFKHKGLYIDLSKIHGYGVFTDTQIDIGELIEELPVTVYKIPLEFCENFFSNYNNEVVTSSMGMFFPYLNPDSTDEYWHASGYVAHLNTSKESNIKWVLKKDIALSKLKAPGEIASFTATRTIHPGEELVISYRDYMDWNTYKTKVLNK